ncbi:low affinity iron permease family protein [Nannocystis radixulma]|uniref:Low affinity iron permease family protein n=1 Tax=Nannocystis radixulma TaxID=2995305 RepID=A0ABT5BM96_9BACT|nr:low affinity iron permease family protein [Nannocystis radixulma]MDC0675283.1 low affinity iron permease family protein [Nannocystis radixulma]
MKREREECEETTTRQHFSSRSEWIANLATRFVVHAATHWLAAAVVVTWLVTGPLVLGWTEVADAIEEVVAGLSFLMLFLLQRSQSKDTLALQLKLDELIASNPAASNRVLDAEDVPEEELEMFRRHFALLQRLSREASPLTQEDAYRRHEEEQRLRQRSRSEEPAGELDGEAHDRGGARPPR